MWARIKRFFRKQPLFDVTIGMKSGNIIRFISPEIKLTTKNEKLTSLNWVNVKGEHLMYLSSLDDVDYIFYKVV